MPSGYLLSSLQWLRSGPSMPSDYLLPWFFHNLSADCDVFVSGLLCIFFVLNFLYAIADEANAYMFCSCFFVFFHLPKNMRQPFSGMAERIFMKLLPNDSGECGVCNVVPKWGLVTPPGERLRIRLC